MSRVIEFNVGDPKSNQQTASKVDCKIIINNKNSTPSHSSDTNRDENRVLSFAKEITQELEPNGTKNDNLGVGVETFNTESEPKSRNPSGSTSKLNVSQSSKLRLPVKCTHRSVPSTVSRYVMVSRQPVVTAEEIDNNIDFHKKLNDILIRRLTEKINLKHFISELLDNNERIILKGPDLCALISVLLSNDELVVLDTDINITYHTDTFVSCFKAVELPYKTIDNIKINNQDFKSVQNEAYNVLTDVYKISLNHFIV